MLGGLVGGAAGILGQIFASLLTRRREREARTQTRLERTYQDFVAALKRQALTVARIEPDIWFGVGEPVLPEPLPEDDLIRLEAAISLHGSREVLAALSTFEDAQRKFNAGVWLFRSYRDSKYSGVTPETVHKADEAFRASRVELLAAVKAIETQARRELTGGPWWRP